MEYINDQLTAGAGADASEAPGGTSGHADGASDSDVEDITAATQRQPRGNAAAASAAAADNKPSDLLKLLRPPQAPRPLFLAAPGVANAQSAYFSFSQFLQARLEGGGWVCG